MRVSLWETQVYAAPSSRYATRGLMPTTDPVIRYSALGSQGFIVADPPHHIPIHEIPAPESADGRAHRIGRTYIARRRAKPMRHLIAGAAGAAASVLIHALFIGSVLWGRKLVSLLIGQAKLARWR